MAYDRDTFQHLAEQRLAEAKVLLAARMPSGAYYLAGYAVECALKAIIASQFRANEIPELKKIRDIHTHNLYVLVGLAGLGAELEGLKESERILYERWTTIKAWSEQARYQIWTKDAASSILEAIDGDEGFLLWLRQRW